MTPSEKIHVKGTKLRTDLFGEQNYTEFYQTATNLCVLCVFILLLFLHKSLTLNRYNIAKKQKSSVLITQNFK